MSIAEIHTPAPRAVWRAVLAADHTAGITQTPDWLDAIQSAGPFRDTSRLYRFDDGRKILLPMATRRHLPRPLGMHASWPFDWGIGGPIADGPVHVEHTQAIYADLRALGALRVTVRLGPLASPAWHTAPPMFRSTGHTTQVVALDGGFDTVWTKRFAPQVRRDIRKAEGSQLTFEVGREPRLVELFYGLYRQSIVRWAHQQHEPLALARFRANRANPPAKLHTVARLLGDRCAIWIAWYAGEPAAGIIVLRHGEHAKYWRGAMNRDLAAPTHANHLLHRLAIEQACQSGCRHYHMGDSRPGSGLARFKSSLGAEAYRTHTYRAERLPIATLDSHARTLVKRLLRFHD